MEDEIAEVVREHGWYGVCIIDHTPPFVYSVGLLQTCNHPEFIVFGIDPSHAHALITALIREIRTGRSFAAPGVQTLNVGGEEHRVGFRPVHPTQHSVFLGAAMGYCRHIGRIGELEAVQVFWPDSQGRFPFEAGCDLHVENLQPRLYVGLSPREVRRHERRWE